jgi:hypothetical protein
MTWVHMTLDNQIDSGEVGRPTTLIRRADGVKLIWSEYITDAELNACGWFQVIPVARPTDTATHTFVRSLIVSLAGPTELWTQRAWTVDELATKARSVNATTISDLAAVQAAMANLKSFLVDPDVQAVLDVANTTALTTQQLNRALKAMVRQQRRDANFDLRLARYVLGQVHPELLDDISDTTGA